MLLYTFSLYATFDATEILVGLFIVYTHQKRVRAVCLNEHFALKICRFLYSGDNCKGRESFYFTIKTS